MKCTSSKTSEKLYSYGSCEPLKVAGCFTANVKVGNLTVEAEFTVIKGEGQALLGRETAIQLGVLALSEELCINSLKEEDTLQKYKPCFEGLGKLKDFELTIPINHNVKPVVEPMHCVPFSLRDKLEKKLAELENLDVIEKAKGPTPWVSPVVVVVPKPNGDLRLCIDMRQTNSAIERERYLIPKVHEVLHDLNGSTIFTKLDASGLFIKLNLVKIPDQSPHLLPTRDSSGISD